MRMSDSIKRNTGKTIFLDRDGVINECPPPHKYVTSWKEFKILPGVIEAIHLLNTAGYTVLVLSNQRGVALGEMSYEDVVQIHRKLNEVLRQHDSFIDDYFFCPHDYGKCHCRKPDIGLFQQAEKKYFVDKKHAWMIGDSDSDFIAAKRYGIPFLWIGENDSSIKKYSSLLDAVKYIITSEST